jgi:hypothetical protein
MQIHIFWAILIGCLAMYVYEWKNGRVLADHFTALSNFRMSIYKDLENPHHIEDCKVWMKKSFELKKKKWMNTWDREYVDQVLKETALACVLAEAHFALKQDHSFEEIDTDKWLTQFE